MKKVSLITALFICCAQPAPALAQNFVTPAVNAAGTFMEKTYVPLIICALTVFAVKKAHAFYTGRVFPRPEDVLKQKQEEEKEEQKKLKKNIPKPVRLSETWWYKRLCSHSPSATTQGDLC